MAGGHLLSRYLMCSFLYYELDEETPLSDSEFDAICKTLAEEWDSFEHPHKWLVRIEDVKAGTGYAIHHYPLMVQSAAWQWKKQYEETT